jgi:hypothetical protein
MRISKMKLAVTSVAYAVTLIAVAMTASSQFNTDSKAVASESEQLNSKLEPRVIPEVSASVRTSAEVFASYRNSKLPLSGGQLSELLTAVGFEGDAHRIAWGIAMRESNARPLALNKSTRTGDSSYGIYQINMIFDLGPERRKKFGLTSNDQLFDPVLNAQVAFLMTGGGKDFGSWGIGPNAYREGAGMSTLKRLNQYPGVVKVTLPE